MATKKQFVSWQEKIEECKNRVAKERDRIDDMISEMEELRDCCDRAWEDLERARDALSELV